MFIKKSAYVTKAARKVQFFWVFRSLFLEHRFKRFLKKQVVKWSFPRLKEQHLIGKPFFCRGFCRKLDLGKLFPLIYLAIVNKKARNLKTKMSSTSSSIKWYLVSLSVCSIAGVSNQNPVPFFFEHPITTRPHWTILRWTKNA